MSIWVASISETSIKSGEKSVKITVYEGSREEYIDPNKGYNDPEKQDMMRNASSEEYLGAVTTHEGTHVVDEEYDGKREERAVDNEKQYLNEANNQKSIVSQSILNNLFK